MAVFPIPDGAHERRMALRKLYGGPVHDPETIYETSSRQADAVPARVISRPAPYEAQGGAVSLRNEGRTQTVFTSATRQIDLDGVTLSVVRVPAGAFVMGDMTGYADELPQRIVTIDTPFWISAWVPITRLISFSHIPVRISLLCSPFTDPERKATL